MKKYVIFAAALTLSLSTAACDMNSSDSMSAEGSMMSNSSMSFDQLDANGNGKISRDEFHGTMSDMGVFANFDANNDGRLSENEWNDIGWEYDYEAWDVNHDGYVGADEFYDGWYAAYDENGDGVWDESEYGVFYDDADEWGIFDI